MTYRFYTFLYVAGMPDLNLTAYTGQTYPPNLNNSRISPSSGSSFSVLTNHTGTPSPVNGSFVNVVSPASAAPSLTDFTLEQAVVKIQELSQENASLKGINVLCIQPLYCELS